MLPHHDELFRLVTFHHAYDVMKDYSLEKLQGIHMYPGKYPIENLAIFQAMEALKKEKQNDPQAP